MAAASNDAVTLASDWYPRANSSGPPSTTPVFDGTGERMGCPTRSRTASSLLLFFDDLVVGLDHVLVGRRLFRDLGFLVVELGLGLARRFRLGGL